MSRIGERLRSYGSTSGSSAARPTPTASCTASGLRIYSPRISRRRRWWFTASSITAWMKGFQLFTTLQRLGVPSKMLYFPDEGHWVLKPQNSQLWYKTVNDWVDQWVGK